MQNYAMALVLSIGLASTPVFAQKMGSCGPETAVKESTAQLASFKVKTPVYIFERAGGRFLKGDLVSDKWTVISDHGFEYSPSVVSSGDGKWIAYDGELKGASIKQYWLYNRATGTERMYHQHPAYGGEIPRFSPDGKSIMFFANYDRRWATPEGYGLYVYDLDSLRATFLGNPAAFATPANNPSAWSEWSADGTQILLAFRAFNNSFGDKTEWFVYRFGGRGYEKIRGDFDMSELAPRFFRGNERIAAYKQAHSPGSAMARRLASPDGRWIATVNDRYELVVEQKGGSSQTVSVGRYDNCTGVTVGIRGWIDPQHMVYSADAATFIYDAATGRKALIPLTPDRVAAFFW